MASTNIQLVPISAGTSCNPLSAQAPSGLQNQTPSSGTFPTATAGIVSTSTPPTHGSNPHPNAQTSWPRFRQVCITCVKFLFITAGGIITYLALSTAMWSSAKDYRDDCRSQKEIYGRVSEACAEALRATLSTPMGFSMFISKSHGSRQRLTREGQIHPWDGDTYEPSLYPPVPSAKLLVLLTSVYVFVCCLLVSSLLTGRSGSQPGVPPNSIDTHTYWVENAVPRPIMSFHDEWLEVRLANTQQSRTEERRDIPEYSDQEDDDSFREGSTVCPSVVTSGIALAGTESFTIRKRLTRTVSMTITRDKDEDLDLALAGSSAVPPGQRQTMNEYTEISHAGEGIQPSSQSELNVISSDLTVRSDEAQSLDDHDTNDFVPLARAQTFGRQRSRYSTEISSNSGASSKQSPEAVSISKQQGLAWLRKTRLESFRAELQGKHEMMKEQDEDETLKPQDGGELFELQREREMVKGQDELDLWELPSESEMILQREHQRAMQRRWLEAHNWLAEDKDS